MDSNFGNLGEWIKRQWGDQDALAEKLKISRATVSAYKTGRINIPPDTQDKMRKLGYDGPWPDEGGGITRADLESIREEIRTQAAWVHEEARKRETALAAMLQEALMRLESLQGNRPA